MSASLSTPATRKKLDISHIPQANNIFSLKKLIGLFSTESAVLRSEEVAVLFEEPRARCYYVGAASKTLGWIESSSGKGWSLTALGKTLHRVLSKENEFCRLAHQDLLGQAYYLTVHTNVGDGQALENVAQQMVKDTGMGLNTARRRASTWISWQHDLNAGMQGKTKALVAIRLRSRSDAEKRDLKRAFDAAKPLFREQTTQVRTFQKNFRAACMDVHGYRCALSGVEDTDMLVASHIKPVRDCAGEDAVDPLNGLILETRFDRLFDQGLITFEDNGAMRISSKLSTNYIQQTGLSKAMALRDVHPKTKVYLAYHREYVFQDEHPMVQVVPVQDIIGVAVASPTDAVDTLAVS